MPKLRYTHEQKEYRVSLKDRTSIGRSDDNEICVPLDALSRHHALIVRDGVTGTYTLSDNGSANGVMVKGQRVATVTLEPGTTFSLGVVEFTFLTDEAVPTLFPAETLVKPAAAPPTVVAAPAVVSAAASASKPLIPLEKLENAEAAVALLGEARKNILKEIGKAIVGQVDILEQIVTAMFARGHCLMIGVPGLAKTLMVRAIGGALDLESKRIQFTPDLMPSDITGTDILEEDPVTGKRKFVFHKGPVFTNLLLADEINRTPPKTQAALLEAMQERRVTVAGDSMELPNPFLVLATQNPLEQEGTYPLPEAQLDRFMFCLNLTYPSPAEEQRVLIDTTRDMKWDVKAVLNAEAILRFQALVRQVPVSEHVALYALNLVRGTRPGEADAPDYVKRWIRYGAGTRAGQYLLLAAKSHALLQGRFSVACGDVRAHALPVLRHRIFCNFAADSEGISTDDIIKKILDSVKEPTYAKAG